MGLLGSRLNKDLIRVHKKKEREKEDFMMEIG
jgi:hypothetical protein